MKERRLLSPMASRRKLMQDGMGQANSIVLPGALALPAALRKGVMMTFDEVLAHVIWRPWWRCSWRTRHTSRYC